MKTDKGIGYIWWTQDKGHHRRLFYMRKGWSLNYITTDSWTSKIKPHNNSLGMPLNRNKIAHSTGWLSIEIKRTGISQQQPRLMENGGERQYLWSKTWPWHISSECPIPFFFISLKKSLWKRMQSINICINTIHYWFLWKLLG